MAGSLAGFLGVALGAFAAHGLKSHLEPAMLAAFETGVRYQLYHALALFAVAWAHSRWPLRVVAVAGYLFIAGVAIFCGSLYLLSLSGARWWGAITPLGGLTLLAGWLCLARGAYRGTR